MSSAASTLELPRNRSLTVAAGSSSTGVRLKPPLFKRPPRSTMAGLGAVAVVLLVCLVGIDLPLLAAAQEDTVYKYLSGSLLLGYILVQWNLFAHREKDQQPALMAKWYRRHKVLGALAPLAFALHTTSLGHALLLALSLCFLLVLLSGFLNRDFLNIQSRRFWQAWTILHVGSAFAMYALIALHVWTALSFHR